MPSKELTKINGHPEVVIDIILPDIDNTLRWLPVLPTHIFSSPCFLGSLLGLHTRLSILLRTDNIGISVDGSEFRRVRLR
jgi:hypothetical protein